jgi:AcrR family transcriptional regulator
VASSVQTSQSRSAATAADTRRRLIESAERLIAEHGPDGVSLRQISTEAGQNNNFSVQYHFGTREGLLDAIVAHRLPRIDALRAELLDQATASGRATDVRSLLDVLFWPLAYEARDSNSWYVSFLTRAQLIDGLRLSPIGVDVADTLMRCLAPLPVPIRQARLQVVTGGCLAALAGYEQHKANRRRPGNELPFDAFVIDLLDGAVQALLTPLSPAARAALRPAKSRSGGARA